MSYRIGHTPPPMPNRSVQNLTTWTVVNVINGSVFNAAYEASYIEVTEPESIESRKTLEKYNISKGLYDRRIKKLHNSKNDIPIHFNHEYYKYVDGEKVYLKPDVEVILDEDNPISEYIEASGWIDEKEDNVIRVKIKPNIPSQKLATLKILFTVVVKDDTIGYRDVALNGVINVWNAMVKTKEM